MVMFDFLLSDSSLLTMPLIIWTCLACFLIFIVFQLIQYWNFRTKIKKLPGPRGYPIVGILPEMLSHESTDILPHTMKIWNEYSHNGLYSVSVLDRTMVTICQPEYVQILLSSNDQINKSDDYKNIAPWIGMGILTNTGKDWHSRRKLLTPAFHFRILEDFFDIMNMHAQNFVEKLKTETDKECFPFFPHMSHSTLEVICESSMGCKMTDMGKSVSDYLEGIKTVTQLGQYRVIRPWFSNDWIFALTSKGRTLFKNIKILNDLTNKVIKKRKAERKTHIEAKPKEYQEEDIGQKKRLAFLDLILDLSDKGKALTDRQIQEEVDTIMFAGHDTTAIAITWTLYLLGHHPEIQDKLRKEVFDVIGDNSKTEVAGEHLRELKYMDRVIKEVLRLYSPVPVIARETTKDMMFEPYEVPAGVTIFVMPYLIHRNPAIYPNPEKFDPDRFLPEEIEKRHPYSYIPFSAGPRNCIGQKFAMMEMKIYLSYLIRSYSFESIQEPKDLKLLTAGLLTDDKGVLMKIKKIT